MTPELKETRSSAEGALRDAWGERVSLQGGVGLGGSDRSNVYRFLVVDGPDNAPESVVVKAAAAMEGETYDPGVEGGPAWRLFNDWAGLQFLTKAAGESTPAPRFYAGNSASGLIILEDLGSGKQLDHLLLGEDAEAAEAGLMGLMKALGRMHALTVGKRAAFESLRNNLGPTERGNTDEEILHVRRRLDDLGKPLDVRITTETKTDLESFTGFLDKSGPFQAYSHHDPCPDNCLWVGEEIKLLDFEFGGFRHALLDGVYGRIHFPTCWCVNRLPEHIYIQMERVYRTELARGCPEAGDDALFSQAVVGACAWHLIGTLHPHVLEEDGEWGIATRRQRALVRLDRFAEVAETFGHCEALAATTVNLAAALRRRWPKETEEMPFYPAFR